MHALVSHGQQNGESREQQREREDEGELNRLPSARRNSMKLSKIVIPRALMAIPSLLQALCV
jgi:hypothetical protein